VDRCGLQQRQDFPRALGIHEKGGLARGGVYPYVTTHGNHLIEYFSIIGMDVSVYGNCPLTRCSIPISPDRPIEVRILWLGDSSSDLHFQDNYVDAYLQVIKHADPLRTSLVFSCGMGAVRTTFAMTAACLVRRRQLMLRGLPDPYATRLLSTPNPNSSGINTVRRSHTSPFSADLWSHTRYSLTDTLYVFS
jgi:hypothetical protein